MSSGVIAHVVGGGPAWPLWITASLMFGGGLAAAAGRARSRRTALAAAAVGLVGTVVYLLLPSAPTAPAGIALRISSPPEGATVTSPVLVEACSAAATLPGTGRLLSISVDGRQVAEVSSSPFVLNVGTGRHTLRAELVTADHREYAPPLLADVAITVSGAGTLGNAARCST